MAVQSLRRLLTATKKKKRSSRGFTLMELLISIIIASVVTSGLLYLVNEVLRVDRREAKLENVQRDMQRAVDYMSDELRESVYVYTDPTTVTSKLSVADLPSGSGGTEAIPILAFWKPVSLSDDESKSLGTVNCFSLSEPLNSECSALKLRQSYYSLVIYFTLGNTETDTSPNWDGQARIIRYSLPQYKKGVIGTTGQQTKGFLPPGNDFENWVPASGGTEGIKPVLVDYVDSPTSWLGSLAKLPDPPGADPSSEACNEFGNDFTRSPSAVSGLDSNSFLACISQPGEATGGMNQEVVILLRGNAKTAAQEFSNPSSSTNSTPTQSVLPTIKRRVLVRGAANKNPNN